VKNQQKAVSTEEKLDIICQVGKGEQIVDISRNVRFAYSRVRTICDNADRVPESANWGAKVFV
jgi:hypothetical protein